MSLSGFFSGFGWPEAILSLVIVIIIVASHEGRKIAEVFGYGKEKKREDTHSEE
jgi:hypothetical protein